MESHRSRCPNVSTRLTGGSKRFAWLGCVLALACHSAAHAQPLAGSITTFNLPLPHGPSTVDAQGNVYSTTSVMPPATTTPDAAQTQAGGGTCYITLPFSAIAAPCYQVYITKSDGSGNTIFATWLGGASNSNGQAITVDATGSIYVAGTTGSSFPTTANAAIETSTAPPVAYGDANATFAAKLSADGSKFVYVTFLPAGMATVNGIAVDALGNLYIAGATSTTNPPPMHPAVVKLSPDGSTVVYTTVFAGPNRDSAISVAADAAGNAYVTGLTGSPDFPVTAGAIQSQLAGVQNAFVTKLDPVGNLAFSTYLGGSGKDSGGAVKVDTSGNIYVAGSTTSLNFPTTAGSVELNALIPAGATTPAGFVTKITPQGTLGYSTYFTSGMLALGASGDLYVAGGAIPGELPVTPSAPLPCVPGSVNTVGGDYVAHLGANGIVLDATYLPLKFLSGFGVTASGVPVIVGLLYEGVTQVAFGGPGWTAGPCMTMAALSSATLSPGYTVPGEFMTFLGVGIGPQTGVSASATAQGTPTSLGGVQVLFDGNPAPVLYAQSGQVNAQAPFELSGQASTTIVLKYGGNTFGPVTAMPLPLAYLALFRLQVGVTAQAVAENQDTSLNGPSNPAAPGSLVTLWGTGFPPLTSPCATGGLNPDSAVDLAPGYIVNMVGGGTVQYAGAAPTLACGVVQINMQVPADAASGPLLVTPQVCTNGGLTCTTQPTGSMIYVK